MPINTKKYLSLVTWIVALIAISSLIGAATKPEISAWYISIKRSPLTPPSYVFSVVWTILYALIATCGWLIWRNTDSKLKALYSAQLVLNWSWMPCFFSLHLIGAALVILALTDIVVGAIIWCTYRTIPKATLLMTPYFLWILFATYLNFFIWLNN